MPPMSDREAWITFAAAAYTGWLANGDYTEEDSRLQAAEDADWFLAELNKRYPLPSPKPTVVEDGDSRSMVADVGYIVDGPRGPEIVSEAGVTK